MKIGRLIFASAAVLALSIVASATNAATITIGLQESGFNGGAITTVASGIDFVNFTGSYGSFTNNSVSGSSDTLNGALLGTTALDVSSTTSGTLIIYVTAQNIAAPIGTLGFLSSLTSNLLPNGWNVTESTFISAANSLFTGTQLASHSFTTTGTFETINFASTGALYSVTEKYTIFATKAGQALSTASISAVPGPVLGAGLPGLILACGGLLALARRRRHAAV